MMARTCAVAMVVALLAACSREDGPAGPRPRHRAHHDASPTDPASGFVGSATMQADGTIVLRLSSYDERIGGRAEGVLRYPKTHTQYAAILAHVGPLAPGEVKPVKPWD